MMIILLAVYFIAVFACANRGVRLLEGGMQASLDRSESAFRELGRSKNKIDDERVALQNQALEIFTLYEIMKGITKSLNEKDAFEIFKKKLRDHVTYRECRFLSPVDAEVNDLRKSDDYFVFTLKSKKMKIGFLAIQRMLEEDREKAMILGHQFALALRRVRLHQEIEQIATTDSLTDVHTRRYLMERLTEEIKRSRARNIKMSFIMLDVDYFKNLNDKYGHLTGDQVLREIGFLIKENIREIDIPGRYGGEEFCVVLPDTDREGAQYAAERIREAADKAIIKAYDANVKITVSVGTSTFPLDGTSAEELVDKADWALYRAKKQGRNVVRSFGVYKDGEESDK